MSHNIKKKIMKAIKIIVLFTITTTTFFAQEASKEKVYSNDTKGVNEFRIGAIHALNFHLNANYERILDKYSGFGATLTVYNNNSSNEAQVNLMLTPYYRFYFSETKEYGAQGFFVEGFSGLVSGSDKINYLGKRDYTSFLIGFGLGKKWVNKKGFIFEWLLGYGRGMSKSPIDNEYRDFLKGDLSIGYRF